MESFIHTNILGPLLIVLGPRRLYRSCVRELTYAILDVYESTWTEMPFLQIILGDSIVIWRAWVVWGRRLPAVIVPLALLVGVACMDRNQFRFYKCHR